MLGGPIMGLILHETMEELHNFITRGYHARTEIALLKCVQSTIGLDNQLYLLINLL